VPIGFIPYIERMIWKFFFGFLTTFLVHFFWGWGVGVGEGWCKSLS
jgi:hypothetical protein